MNTPSQRFSLRGEVLFIIAALLWLLLYQTALRCLFLYSHYELARDIPLPTLLQAFGKGLRFDAIICAYALLPMVFGLLFTRGERWRRGVCLWLSAYAGLITFLAVLELDFYKEFHQRLNSLVFEYLKEDAATVLSMIWFGFPVLRYLVLIAALVAVFHLVITRLDRWTRHRELAHTSGARHHLLRWGVFLLAFVCLGVQARGTLRQGPPLRWGDAFFSQYTFANHLGLNGAFTLAKAATSLGNKKDDNSFWFNSLPAAEATQLLRQHWLQPQDQLLDADSAALRRLTTPPVPPGETPIKNVVIILMESFSGEFTGALGKDAGVTPAFDQLAREGLLFERFFSNGTHTHQGMFATLACFPNLPGHEYLMYQPEGAHSFSGISRLLAQEDFNRFFVYNGSFTWDNQIGFFQNQGMSHFIGREDYINPKFSDPTWGVSDEDMFDRALVELAKAPKDKPFLAILQTLSNHTPYSLPEPLPMEAIYVDGKLSERLTAMRYADYALGKFFEQARQQDYYRDTLFVLLGDHAFGVGKQLTDIDLLRFHVPLLLVGPGITERYGQRSDVVATQVDVVPTIMSLLGKPYQHQCWGRDVLNLPPDKPGYVIIKPSGNDPTVGIVSGDRLLVRSPDGKRQLFQYRFTPESSVTALEEAETEAELWQVLQAYLQTALISLRDNTTAP